MQLYAYQIIKNQNFGNPHIWQGMVNGQSHRSNGNQYSLCRQKFGNICTNFKRNSKSRKFSHKNTWYWTRNSLPWLVITRKKLSKSKCPVIRDYLSGRCLKIKVNSKNARFGGWMKISVVSSMLQLDKINELTL